MSCTTRVVLLLICIVLQHVWCKSSFFYKTQKRSDFTGSNVIIAPNSTLALSATHPSFSPSDLLLSNYLCMFLQVLPSKNVTFNTTAEIQSISGQIMQFSCKVPFIMNHPTVTTTVFVSIFSFEETNSHLYAKNLSSVYEPAIFFTYTHSEVLLHSNTTFSTLLDEFRFKILPIRNDFVNGNRIISGGIIQSRYKLPFSLAQKQIWFQFQLTNSASWIKIKLIDAKTDYEFYSMIVTPQSSKQQLISFDLNQPILWTLFLDSSLSFHSTIFQNNTQLLKVDTDSVNPFPYLFFPNVRMEIEFGSDVLMEAMVFSCEKEFFNFIDSTSQFQYCSMKSCTIKENGKCNHILPGIEESIAILSLLVPLLHLIPCLFLGILIFHFLKRKIQQAKRVKSNYETQLSNLNSASITFENISAFHKEKIILNQVNGYFLGGGMNILMGPSGAGKSSLLNIICGTFTGQYKGQIKIGSIPFNYHQLKDIIGVVPQKDTVTPSFSVYLNLFFSGLLRLFTLNFSVVNQRVKEIAEKLGLTSVIHSTAGDDHKRGISGGQLKRLNIGLEMIANPKILLLDEPTSGLDGFVSLEIMKTIKKLVIEEKITVIAVLHQPREEIFNLFDHLVLFGRNKKIAYCGPITDAEQCLYNLGRVGTYYKNPADRIVSYVEHTNNTIVEQQIDFPMTKESTTAVTIPTKFEKLYDFIIHYIACVLRNFTLIAMDLNSFLFNIVFIIIASLIVGFLFLNNQFSGAAKLTQYRACQDSLIPFCEVIFSDNLMACLSRAILILSLCGSLSGTTFLRKELEMIQRENQRGLSLLIYFLAKDTVFMLIVALLTFIFSVIVCAMTNIHSFFVTIWFFFFLIYYTASGIGIIFSLLISNQSLMQLASAVAVFLCFIFGGGAKTLVQLKEAFPPIPILPPFSFIRYYLESMYLTEASLYQSSFDLSKNFDILGYSFENEWYWMLGFCFAIGYRFIAIILLYASTKSAKIQGTIGSVLCAFRRQ